MLLDCQLAKKDYLQINAFLANGGGVEKNLEALQMKATASFGGGAIGKTLALLMKALVGATVQNSGEKDGRLDAIRSDFWDVNISFTHLILH